MVARRTKQPLHQGVPIVTLSFATMFVVGTDSWTTKRWQHCSSREGVRSKLPLFGLIKISHFSQSVSLHTNSKGYGNK